jgi:ATP-binding cassette, subfamily B, bacterial MsbA
MTLASIQRGLFAQPYGTPALIRRLMIEYGWRHRATYVMTFVLLGIVGGCTALTAYVVGHLVNLTYLSRSFSAVAVLCVVVIGIFTVKGLATYGQAVLMSRISTELVADIQTRMFDRLLRQNLGYFSDTHSSQYMAQVGYSAAAVPATLNLIINAIGRDVVCLVGLVAVMVIQDPVMSIIGIIAMPAAMLLVRNLIGRVRAMTLDRYAAGAGILETMQETLQGMRVVKAFGLEPLMRRRVNDNAEIIKDVGRKLALLSNRSAPLTEMLGGVIVALGFLYGAYRVIVTGATPGEFISFLVAFLLAYEPAKRLARLQLDLHLQLAAVRMLFEFFDGPVTEPEDDERPHLRLGAGRIEFAGVIFGYRPNERVIRDLSFVAGAGQLTALVGQSGGGKSTIFNLVLRFYDVHSGAILIDGQDIATVSRRSLRQQIAYVGQDIFLFRGTIRDNIAAGKLDATEAEIVEAARAAYAHEFIIALPMGYASPAGEHGLQLSTGQRQRIAIARALLKNAPIVLLDEATSALDSESEREVQLALMRLRAGRTTLVIAHRLHTVEHADQIHVIENGTVAESGRHDALLRARGRYAALQMVRKPTLSPRPGAAG